MLPLRCWPSFGGTSDRRTKLFGLGPRHFFLGSGRSTLAGIGSGCRGLGANAPLQFPNPHCVKNQTSRPFRAALRLDVFHLISLGKREKGLTLVLMIDVDATTSEREAAMAGLSQELLRNGYKLYL